MNKLELNLDSITNAIDAPGSGITASNDGEQAADNSAKDDKS